MKTIIETHHLTKRFGKTIALNDVTLCWPTGEIIALTGPNGSGKSTLFRILMNLHRPSWGDAEILGNTSTKLKRSDFNKIGFVSEDRELPQNLTGEQYLQSLRWIFKNWNRDRENTLAEDFGFDTSQQIKSMSRGQKTHLQIISTLSYNPEILFLDEPGGLDVNMRRKMLSCIIDTSFIENPPTVILATHDLEDVDRVASWVTMLDRGKVLLSDSVENIQSTYEGQQNSYKDLFESLSHK